MTASGIADSASITLLSFHFLTQTELSLLPELTQLQLAGSLTNEVSF